MRRRPEIVVFTPKGRATGPIGRGFSVGCGGGTGLGLFIVQAAAENHDAKLEIGRSELGGAEVRLVFPAAK